MVSSTTIGLIAGTLTTVAFVPQVLKTWRTRSANDISLGMFAVFSLGVSLWLLYGLALREWPIVLANACTLILAGIMVIFKLRFK